MLGLIHNFYDLAHGLGLKLEPFEVRQTLSEDKLIEIIPSYDGWIIGDDPATKKVFFAGKEGKLKAAVKWGIGVDNVDFVACKEFGIRITNTPGMFGAEVADMSVGYLIALARQTFYIDRSVRNGEWPKPVGVSLAGKKVAVVGYGDIGRKTSIRLLASEMQIIAYDPFVEEGSLENGVSLAKWPDRINECDFIVINCSLTPSSFHLLGNHSFELMKKGVRIINVGRGAVIDEFALVEALDKGIVHSVALDVFENEPLGINSSLRKKENCIFGSHNSSNTKEAVVKTSCKSIELLNKLLVENQK